MSSIEDFKIPLQEILSATDRFSKANIIARGGFGKVYRGRSKQHGMLAIKRLDRSHGQRDREFNTEIAMLSAYKHENLVALVGFCEEGREKILVYKYETNGSLDKFLSEKDLTWELRLQIGIGSARGLRYLHDQIGPGHRVIHRDLKSSNILLDENLNPKISDFGLATIGLANVPFSVRFSNPCGTFGYVDPEFLHGILTQKCDVYSFGVVLFELLFGKLVCLPPRVDDHHFTVEMARTHYKNNRLDEMIDPDLRSQMTTASLRTFSTIAYQCVKNHIDLIDHRPTMRLVLEQLEKALHQGLASSGFSHDVYICVKEDDIRPYIAKKLCAALEKQGVSVYKDNLIDAYGPYLKTKERYSRDLRLFLYTNAYKKLQEALEKSPALSVQLKAIEQSRSSIIIFSDCIVHDLEKLDEVVKIMECLKERKQFVLPIFYQVAPSKVSKQARDVMDLKMLRSNRCEERQKARNKAANIQGGIEFQSRDFEWSDLDKVASKIKHQLSGKSRRAVTKLKEKTNRHQS